MGLLETLFWTLVPLFVYLMTGLVYLRTQVLRIKREYRYDAPFQMAMTAVGWLPLIIGRFLAKHIESFVMAPVVKNDREIAQARSELRKWQSLYANTEGSTEDNSHIAVLIEMCKEKVERLEKLGGKR